MIRHPTAEDESELQVITINLLTIQFCLFNTTPNLNAVVQAMKGFPNFHEFAASVRDDIYTRMDAFPLDKGSSNVHLKRDIDELLQEWTLNQGTTFSILLSNQQPEEGLEAESVLRNMDRLLALQICDYSSDVSLQLIVACSIALSQRLQVIAYDQSSSLVRYCWLVCDRLERFPCAGDTVSSQSRWSTISPRINHVQPINPYLSGPPPPVSPPEIIKQILSFVERIDQKVSLSLNISSENMIVEQQLRELLSLQSKRIQQNNKLLSHLVSDDNSGGKSQH